MSHIDTVKLKILSLAALEAAAKEHGCQWLNKKTYEWYGDYVGNTPLPEGMTQDSLGKCDYVIKVPGVKYEIGVVKLKDGNYTLAYDFYSGMRGADGGKLLDKFGQGLKKLCQSYSKHANLATWRKHGWLIHEVEGKNGKLKLEAQRI